MVLSWFTIVCLKSKLEETEAKELKKNIFILSLLIIGVGAFGIYLSF